MFTRKYFICLIVDKVTRIPPLEILQYLLVDVIQLKILFPVYIYIYMHTYHIKS